MAGQIRIRLKAYDHVVLDQAAADIVRTVEKSGARLPDGTEPAATIHKIRLTPPLLLMFWPTRPTAGRSLPAACGICR